MRLLLFQAAQGRCQRCGCELGEDWEADHVEPWSITGRTNIFEMQALCPRCNREKGKQRGMLTAQGVEWRAYFSPAPEFREQKGQIDSYRLAAAMQRDEATSWLLELVTGYGKTLVAYGAYHILKERGVVRNMLVLVPTDDQRTQFQEDYSKANALLGISLGEPWIIEKAARELRLIHERRTDIFVASYQQLERDGGFLRQLLEHGAEWMLALDECHHLGEEGAWAERVGSLPGIRFRVGLSATPVRSDRAKVLHVPAVPTVKVRYQEAYEEEVVKRVVGHIEHHFLDVDVNGERMRLTTELLSTEGETDFSRYEAKRQLRYNRNYLSQMLIDPIRDLIGREASHPGENRVIVFAMTCRHACYIAGQIRDICTEMGASFRSDWIGVGEGADGETRSPEQNKEIVKAFKAGKIQILVQVAKANEGFDVPQASVLVFLHLIGADGRLLQQIGRGLRRNSALPFAEDTVSVYASADTPIAQVIERMEVEASEVAERIMGDMSVRQLGLWDIPDLILIDSTHDRTDIVMPEGIDWMTAEQRDFCSRFSIPPEEYLRHYGIAPRPATVQRPAEIGPQASLRQIAQQVERHTSTLTGNIVRLLRNQGMNVEKETIGRIKASVHREWARIAKGLTHDQMLYSDFNRKHVWLQSVNERLKETGEVPSWVDW